jgi:hypothetical protein
MHYSQNDNTFLDTQEGTQKKEHNSCHFDCFNSQSQDNMSTLSSGINLGFCTSDAKHNEHPPTSWLTTIVVEIFVDKYGKKTANYYFT